MTTLPIYKARTETLAMLVKNNPEKLEKEKKQTVVVGTVTTSVSFPSFMSYC